MGNPTQPDDGVERQPALEGYDAWLGDLETLPWWEILDRAYEREMASRLAAAKDQLREEGQTCQGGQGFAPGAP
jgi:hypothetical protein